MEFLNDEYEQRGTDFGEFCSYVKDMAERTERIDLNTDELIVLHLSDNEELRQLCEEKAPGSLKDKVLVRVLSKRTLEENNERSKAFPLGCVAASLFTEEQWRETKVTNLLLFKIGDEKILVSSLAENTLFQRAGLAGKAMKFADLQRNVLLAHSLMAGNRLSGEKGQKITLIVRSNDVGQKKVFAVLAPSYNYLPQICVIPMAEGFLNGSSSMGKGVVSSWHIGHDRTAIVIEFPDEAEELSNYYSLKDKMIPGVFIETSDIGMSSLRFAGTWRKEGNNEFVISSEYTRKHQGNFSSEEFFEKGKTAVFSEIRALPETLSKLMTREISVTELPDAIKALVEKTAPFSKKQKEALISSLCTEISATRSYTYYDVADIALTLPDRVEGLDKESTAFDEFRKRCARYPYTLLDISSKKKEKEDESLFLV